MRHELHEAYAATGDPAIRAELLESYDGFARALALKFRHRESVDDLVQVARIGLLHAIDHFDPALGRPFPLFARITITGELKRHIRDRTWAMRVPRSLQEDYLNVMRTLAELTAERSDSPSMEALAARCGISVERVLEAIELRVNQRALSIDVPAVAGADDPVIELGQEDIGFRRLEDRQLLADLLGRLPERDRRIVELRFIEELTQSEIAAGLRRFDEAMRRQPDVRLPGPGPDAGPAPPLGPRRRQLAPPPVSAGGLPAPPGPGPGASRTRSAATSPRSAVPAASPAGPSPWSRPRARPGGWPTAGRG